MKTTNQKSLYNENSLKIMQVAEDAPTKGCNRVQEIKNFALEAGIVRIGIANCISFNKEAEAVKNFLSPDFEIHAINCKCGKITKQQLLGGTSTSVLCNPAGQSDYLASQNTELNIAMGLCVGHDMIFNKLSKAPVTTLVVKDRANKHNTILSIDDISGNS